MPADCIVELGDEEVENKVDKVETERGQAMDKVVESAVIDSFIKSWIKFCSPKRKDGKRSIRFVRLLFWHRESPKVIVENIGEGSIRSEIFVVFDGADIVEDKSTEDWVEIANDGDERKKKDGGGERGPGLVDWSFRLHYSTPDPSLCGGSTILRHIQWVALWKMI